jgi:hypothetical protein
MQQPHEEAGPIYAKVEARIHCCFRPQAASARRAGPLLVVEQSSDAVADRTGHPRCWNRTRQSRSSRPLMPARAAMRVSTGTRPGTCSSPKARISAPSMVRLRSGALLSRENRSERLLGSCKRQPRPPAECDPAGEDPRHRDATRSLVRGGATGRSPCAEHDRQASGLRRLCFCGSGLSISLRSSRLADAAGPDAPGGGGPLLQVGVTSTGPAVASRAAAADSRPRPASRDGPTRGGDLTQMDNPFAAMRAGRFAGPAGDRKRLSCPGHWESRRSAARSSPAVRHRGPTA